nr:glycosyltransferase family 39 protein [Ancylobacter crimeensis]
MRVSELPLAGDEPASFIARAWRSARLTRLASLGLFAALTAFVLLTFRDYGISNDEPVQHTYGQLLLTWYASGFTDDRAFHYINLYLYGGLFDMIAAGLEHVVPLPVYEWRHLLSAMFGLFGFVGVWKLARLLGSEKAGILAVALLAVTGMYGGAMFTHTKDVPFAAFMVWSLYCITALVVRLPEQPRWRVVVGLGLAVGCAFGQRVGGVFAVLYLLLTVGIAAVVFRDIRLPLRLLPRLCVAGLIALAIIAVTWPWSMLPPTNFFKAMGAFSNFTFDLSTLINGQDTPINELPGTYMSEYLLIKLPEATLLGLVAALAVAIVAAAGLVRAGGTGAAIRLHPRRVLAFLPLGLAIAVPVAFTLIEHPPLYNGIRHFLFVMPPVTILAALGFRAAWRRMNARALPLGLAFGAAALAVYAYNLDIFVRMHPYQYVTYNELVGGTAGAWGRFEGDYWSDSLREAAIDLRRGIEHEVQAAPHRYKVAVCAEDVQASTYLGPNVDMTENWDEADFLLTARNIGCDDVVSGMTYKTVTRMGIPLAMAVDMRARHTPLAEPLPWDDRDDGTSKGVDPDAPAVSLKDSGGTAVATQTNPLSATP